jgi:CoA-transferase family III
MLDELQRSIGDAAELDVYALVAMRAQTHAFTRQGATSCGGASRLIRTGDGWSALTLARDDDVAALEAWLETAIDPADPWDTIARVVASRPGKELWDRAGLLGLPFAILGLHARRAAVVREPIGKCVPRPLEGARVVDFSSLWAGPLCAHLLSRLGARVTKVESTTRPDGARLGPAAFYDALHRGNELVVVDFTTNEGRARLQQLVSDADVVIEASRPRALAVLGVSPSVAPRATAWVSITGYGRSEPWSDRVAFGDDAAVAGGLVAYDKNGPVFCGDAIADPLSGLVAAAAVAEQFRSGQRALVDVAMASVAAAAASLKPTT